MPWPAMLDFTEAVQNPERCFEGQDIAQGTTALTPLGLPLVYSGNFASVYKMTTPNGDVAVRCFTREVRDQQERYGHLSDYLKGVKPEAFVDFQYVEQGIRVRGQWYPIVRMEWAQGDRLDKFVEDHLDTPEILLELAARWRGANGTLRGLGIAHNDLQHGNVMAREQGAVRLVDYDGIFLPQFKGQDSPELGHKHYQHPRRSTQDYHAGIDNFPSLVVYLSLLTLGSDRQLWDRFYNQDNLLFTQGDFAVPGNSDCFKALKSSPDPNVAGLAAVLEELCSRPVDQVPDLESVLQGNLTAPPPAAAASPSYGDLLRATQRTAPPAAPPAATVRNSGNRDPFRANATRNQPMEKRCPSCNARNARLRHDWYTRANALRCLGCNGVFGKTRVKRCPGCGSRKARLRHDWYDRARPLRCLDCNAVYGGADERAPSKPVVGRTPHLNRLLQEAAQLPVDHDTLVVRARGAMMGISAGNLLGLAVESWSHDRIAAKYPNGVRDIDPREVSRPVDDDPAQAIELAEALLDQGDTVVQFANRVIAWRSSNGRGIGHTTRQSIAQLDDGMEPPHAAYAVYRAKGGIAPNGGVMRCAPVATCHRNQPELLTRISADTCAVTHYSPLSQWSCVVVNAAIAILLGGYPPDLQKLLEAAEADGCPDLLTAGRRAGIATTVLECAKAGQDVPESASWLRDNQLAKGHTLLTLQAGLWAAVTKPGLEESLIAIVSAGGDTDTNGALAGAVLGARHGASAIPLRWTAYMAQRDRLAELGERMLAI